MHDPSIHPQRLFLGSCFALIATAVCFATVGAIMGALKSQFVLSNEQVGYIGGAAIWGFTISIFILGPLCDVLGMRALLLFALFCHAAGTLVMIFAGGYWMLFVGALILALGNGTVEAACNPLVATVYSERKTEKLNQFHVWFPGGIVIGGLASYLLDRPVVVSNLPAGVSLWQVQLGLILAPTLIYGILFVGQRFPLTERVQSGITFEGMVHGALGRPLFLILLVCMCITASLELGPGRWVPAVLEAGGIAGILVLAYINGLMAVLRFFAGPVVHRLSPTGVLVGSAVLAGVGLYWFSFATNTAMAFASATVFALGVCYFWPTMLGVTSERVPRSGALGLALIGGMGMLIVGTVTAPQMGRVADYYLHETLPTEQTVAALRQVVEVYPSAAAAAPETIRKEILGAVALAQDVLDAHAAAGKLPEGRTADALRSAVKNSPPGADAAKIVATISGAVLGPADNYGGRVSFRFVAPFAVLLVAVFGVLYLRDRAAGGYKAERLTVDEGR